MGVLVISGLRLRVEVVSGDIDQISAWTWVLVQELLRESILAQLLERDVQTALSVPENRIFDWESRGYCEVQTNFLIGLNILEIKTHCYSLVEVVTHHC